MAQQINLHHPILGVPRRQFSAATMALALGVLALGAAALGAFLTLQTQRLKAQFAPTLAANEQEAARLEALLARRPPSPKDTAALAQEVAQARQALDERRRVRAELDAAGGGAELLRTVARTLPPTVWLSEVRRVGGRIEIAGTALQPEALRPWLASLAAEPAFGGRAPRPLRVERSDGAVEAWQFRVVGGAEGDAK
jgi:Tfp pilus assembly protein PilN